jgi:hypothetical protein
MEAYCEAFSEFKHCMLALLSVGGSPDGDGGGSSGSKELSEFAGMVVRAVRAVRQQAGSFADSQLAQLLRYLLLLHRHQAHTGFHPYWWPDTSQQTQQLCARLLLPQHDALPPAALEPAGYAGWAAEGVREHDVQASQAHFAALGVIARLLLLRRQHARPPCSAPVGLVGLALP